MISDSRQCQCNSCNDPQGYFKIQNLFSELKTEVEKANARYNLGIGDQWSLKWGNITGFIEEQKDLTQYLDKFIIVYKQEIQQTMDELQRKLEAKIQEQVNLLEEDRRKIEQLINSLEEFKQELRSLVEDKVDKSQIPNIQNPFNQAYTNLDSPTITSVGEALDQLLYREMVITTRVTPSVGEIGETLPEVIFSWDYNKAITQQTFDATSLELSTRSKTLTNISSTTSKTLSASDGRKTKTASMQVIFKLASYYGVSNNTSLTSQDIINNFQRDFNFQRGSSITLNAQQGQYIYLMLPQSMSGIQFYVGGFEGGFQIIDSNFQFTRYGKVNNYILYRSDNPGLGTTTINTK